MVEMKKLKNIPAKKIFEDASDFAKLNKVTLITPEIVALYLEVSMGIITQYLIENNKITEKPVLVELSDYIAMLVKDSAGLSQKPILTESYKNMVNECNNLFDIVNWLFEEDTFLRNSVCLNAASSNVAKKHGKTKESKHYYDMTLKESTIPCVGRDEEINEIIRILLRKTKSNPIVIGEAGVGKTEVIHGLSDRIRNGNVPKELINAPVFNLDLTGLLAGTSMRGEFEENVKKTFEEIKKYGETNNIRPIIFIDEIHNIVGAGVGSSGGTGDMANIIKPLLTEGKISVIGATTYNEYEKYFKKDLALDRRFYPVSIEEPSEEDAIKILDGIKEVFESYHNVMYPDNVLSACVKLSNRHITNRHLPDKAIDVMDEAGVLGKIRGNKEITEDIIAEIVSEKTKTPIGAVQENEAEILRNLEETLKSKVFGQDKACEKVAKDIRCCRAFGANKKPISMFFVGSTGTGKTELARTIASSMNMKLIKIDCSELQESVGVAKLTGSAPGYVGYEDGGKLVNEISKNPYSVVLFDEIEKAHSDIYNVLLQIMDDGILTDGKNRKGDFKNAIILFTSNCGANQVGKKILGFAEPNKSEVGTEVMLEEMQKHFKPEFLGRLNAVISFNPVSDVAKQIAVKELEAFRQIALEKNVKVTYDDSVINAIIKDGISLSDGARYVKRIIEDKIKHLIADEILFGRLINGGSVKITFQDNEFKLSKVYKKRSVICHYE